MANSLRFELARHNDTDVDAFASGEAEVDAYFRSRRWLRGTTVTPPTYKFFTAADGVLGFATVAPRGTNLVIFAAGIQQSYQGVKAPEGASYAFCMFREIEALARARPNTRTMSLWVREKNVRARAFYRKFDFAEDVPNLAPDDGTGNRHIGMTKHL